MKNFLYRAENALFSMIVLIILILNIYASVFLVQGYHPAYFKNQILIFLFSLFLLFMIFSLIKKIKIPNERTLIFIVAINLIAFIIRIILNYSFSTGPTSDQAALLYSINDLVLADDYSPILKGGYLNIQSHLASFYYLFYIPMKIFEAHYQYYYHLNAILIQLSFLMLALSAYKLRGDKCAILVTILLNLFIPSYFLDFVIYGDVLSLFFVSLAITAGVYCKRFWLKGILISIFLSLSYMSRATAIVWFIATIISMILFMKGNKKNLILVLVMVVCFLIPPNLSTALLNRKFNAELPMYSLPSNTWIKIGLSYNDNGDAGLYDSYSLDNLILTDYNKETVFELNMKKIIQQLDLYKNPIELLSFMKNKLCNTWIDPDFETMNYIMPDNGMTVEEFKENQSLINGIGPENTKSVNLLGDFIYANFKMIRIVEKIFVFIILIVALSISFCEFKRKCYDRTSIFLELNLVGYFLLQLFMETKPRYVLISFILLIFYCGMEIEKFKFNLKKR